MPKKALHKVSWETMCGRLVAFQSRERVDAVYTEPGNRRAAGAWKIRDYLDAKERYRNRRPGNDKGDLPLPWTADDIRAWVEDQGCTVHDKALLTCEIKRYRVAPGLTDDQMLAFKLRFQ